MNQVIDEDGTVIPGLYAGGEVVGQMWGKTIVPGVGMNGAVTWGRITGKNIMTLDMNEGYEVHEASNIFVRPFDLGDETAVYTGKDYADLTDGRLSRQCTRNQW